VISFHITFLEIRVFLPHNLSGETDEFSNYFLIKYLIYDSIVDLVTADGSLLLQESKRET
jgi:hypothetical protein